MKKLAKFALLGFVAWLFSACSTTSHQLIANFDTQPQAAEIICDGKSLGRTPLEFENYRAVMISDEQMKELKEKQGGNFSLPACKARWLSGYEDYFPIQVNIKDYAFTNEFRVGDKIIKNYLITKKLKRSRDKGYEFDTLVEQRYEKLNKGLKMMIKGNRVSLNLKTNPAGAEIFCDGIDNAMDNVLRTGIWRVAKCKARWISGYEMAFRDRVNLDYEDPSVLVNQTLNRPNTAGYADDMRWALELEKKQILEANERARTQAAQAQAAAQQRAAAAAEAQARAAQQQAQAAQQQATMQMLSQPSALDRTIQQGNEMLKNQSLDGINKSLKSIDRTLKGQPNYGLGGLQ